MTGRTGFSIPIGMLMSVLLASLLAGCSGLSPQVSQSAPPNPTPIPQPTIRYAVFPAPPYMIGAGEQTAPMSGIDVDIVQEIARQMRMPVEYIKCSWARCLELMKSGQADLLSSAYKKPEREEYMLYFKQPVLEALPIAFYYLKGRGHSVNEYVDIYQFYRIGVLHQASYFKRFDEDTQAKKFEVASQDQLFPMLLAGRLDAIAGYVPTENYRIHQEGYREQIERSTFEENNPTPVYMTISKRSPLAGRFEEFNRINQQLWDEGFIDRVVKSYYEKYP